MMTLKEYKEKHGFTTRELARHLGISLSSAHRWLKGDPAMGGSVEKLKKLGIEIPLRPYEVMGKRKSQRDRKVEKVENPGDDFITDVQVAIVKKFGNTIISKKYKAEDIIKQFKKHGFDVIVRDFECCCRDGSGTHYVVETLEVLKERVKKRK